MMVFILTFLFMLSSLGFGGQGWYSYERPRGCELVVSMSRIQELPESFFLDLPKEYDLAIRASIIDLARLKDHMQEMEWDPLASISRRIRVEIILEDGVNPIHIEKDWDWITSDVLPWIRWRGWEGPFFIGAGESDVAWRTAALFNREVEHLFDMIRRDRLTEERLRREGLPPGNSPWVMDLTGSSLDKIHILSVQSLSWGAEGCLVPLEYLDALDANIAWAWRHLAPFELEIPGVQVNGNDEAISLMESLVRRSHLSLCAPSREIDHQKCKALFLAGDPSEWILESLDGHVRQGMTLGIFLGMQPEEMLLDFLEKIGVQVVSTGMKRIPSFLKNSNEGRLKSWSRVSLGSFYQISGLPPRSTVEAYAPDGRPAGWSWKHGKGMVFLLFMPGSDLESTDVMVSWLISMGEIAGCVPVARGPRDLNTIFLRSGEYRYVAVQADGAPGGLFRCKVIFPWVREESIYRFWAYPGVRWVGWGSGRDILVQGVPLEVPMTDIMFLRVTEQ